MAVVTKFLLMAAVVLPASTSPSPSIMKPCQRDLPDLGQCLAGSLQDAMPILVKGVRQYGIPQLDPFHIDEVVVSRTKGSSKGLSVDLNFSKVTAEGIKDFKFLLPDCVLDLKEKKIKLRGTIPTLKMAGQYTVDGKVLSLPIAGNGDAKAVIEGADITYEADVELADGHVQLVNPQLAFSEEHFSLQLDNLFNGDKKLGDGVNSFLNENWREVLEEFTPAIKSVATKMLDLMVNNVLKKVSMDEVFPK